jgi:hypothetical protein
MADFDMRTAFQDGKPIQTIASVGATNWQGIQVPELAERITVGCEASAVYLSFSYADGVAASLVDAAAIPAGQYFTMQIVAGQDTAAVISKTGAAAQVVICVEAG